MALSVVARRETRRPKDLMERETEKRTEDRSPALKAGDHPGRAEEAHRNATYSAGRVSYRRVQVLVLVNRYLYSSTGAETPTSLQVQAVIYSLLKERQGSLAAKKLLTLSSKQDPAVFARNSAERYYNLRPRMQPV